MTTRNEAVKFSKLYGSPHGKVYHERFRPLMSKSFMVYRVDTTLKGIDSKNQKSLVPINEYFANNDWELVESNINTENDDWDLTFHKGKFEAFVCIPNLDLFFMDDFEDDDQELFVSVFFQAVQ